MSQLSDDLLKAAISGVIAGVGSVIFLGETEGSVPFPVLGFQVPPYIAIGGAVAAADLVSELAHQYVFPLINKSEKLTKIESALLQIGLAGGVTAGLLVYGSSAPRDLTSIGYAFGVGSISVIAGDYAFVNFVKPGGGLLF